MRITIKIASVLILLFLMSSCGSSKKAKRIITIQEKLEIEYQKYKGIPYKYGGTTKRGFDCSGFVNAVYFNAFNIDLPRTTTLMSKQGEKISKSKLKPGDLVFFRPSRKYMHMGIYVGHGLFMHSSTSKGIIKSRLDNVYWKGKYKYARRIFKTKR
jgi:cell wall-associated NlpC family hydrolase|tara:strand:+ start:281 stop:748 length:468 start_codon:yes stop_codon:yes gene_type:complete